MFKHNKNRQSTKQTIIDMEIGPNGNFDISPSAIDRIKSAAKNSTVATAVVFNGILASSMATNIDRWMREEFAGGAASVYDKAMDAARHKMQEFGGDHRLFDGGHDLLGAWEAVRAAKPDDNLVQEAGGYLSAIWKDVVTPMGLPLTTLNRDSFDSVAEIMGDTLGVSRDWLMDAASFTATEGIGAIIGAVAVVLNWSKTDVDRFSALVGSFGLSALISANPFLAVVAVVALARSFHEARYRKQYGSLASGITKGGAGTGVFLGAISIVSGPAWIGIVVGIVSAVLAQKAYEKGETAVSKVSWSDVSKFTRGYMKAWVSSKGLTLTKQVYNH
jgi:hypothetical protein